MTTEHELIRRQHLTQTLLDKWKGKSFRLGERDCVRLVADHFRRCGYKVKVPSKGSYRTTLSAVRKLRELGYESLSDAPEALGFERIPPASALTGDVIELPGEEDNGERSPLSALSVALGNGRVLGFYDGVGCAVLQPCEYVAAWRVVPR